MLALAVVEGSATCRDEWEKPAAPLAPTGARCYQTDSSALVVTSVVWWPDGKAFRGELRVDLGGTPRETFEEASRKNCFGLRRMRRGNPAR